MFAELERTSGLQQIHQRVFTARHQRVINPAVAMLEVLGKVNKPHAKVNKAHAAVDPEYLRGKW